MNSTPDSNLYSQKVKAFLEEYEKEEIQNLFKNLAEAARKRCEDLLKTHKIKGVVQSRSKGYDSLKIKLNDMMETSEFIEWFAGSDGFPKLPKEIDKNKIETKGVYEHPDMGDLAGVRVGLFFPDDVLRVAEEIKKKFSVSYTFGTVTDTTRSTVNSRNQDIQRHGDGRWISQDPGENVDHWEHYGYKSWQVVVVWKGPLPMSNDSIEEAPDSTKIFNPLRVEIQVGTVVTQAWAEVQHNVIYKRSIDIKATPTMKRIIDAINGLAITTDIMLKELNESLDKAEKEAERQHRMEKDKPLSMFQIACSDGDHEAVIRLIQDGVDVNAELGCSLTGLLVASMRGHSNVVAQLLHDNRVDVNAKDELGHTGLLLASMMGHSNVVTQLLDDNRVDVNAKDEVGQTALHIASEKGHSNVVTQLLLDDRIDVNAKSDFRQTALHIASKSGYSNIVTQLRVRVKAVRAELALGVRD